MSQQLWNGFRISMMIFNANRLNFKRSTQKIVTNLIFLVITPNKIRSPRISYNYHLHPRQIHNRLRSLTKRCKIINHQVLHRNSAYSILILRTLTAVITLKLFLKLLIFSISCRLTTKEMVWLVIL